MVIDATYATAQLFSSMCFNLELHYSGASTPTECSIMPQRGRQEPNRSFFACSMTVPRETMGTLGSGDRVRLRQSGTTYRLALQYV